MGVAVGNLWLVQLATFTLQSMEHTNHKFPAATATGVPCGKLQLPESDYVSKQTTSYFRQPSSGLVASLQRAVCSSDMADPTFEPYGGVAPWWVGPCGDACAKNLEKCPP